MIYFVPTPLVSRQYVFKHTHPQQDFPTADIVIVFSMFGITLWVVYTSSSNIVYTSHSHCLPFLGQSSSTGDVVYHRAMNNAWYIVCTGNVSQSLWFIPMRKEQDCLYM